MLKYLTHKLRTQSIDEGIRKQQHQQHHQLLHQPHQQQNRHVGEKIDGHDSGTESDGEINQRDNDMELSSASSRQTTAPTTTSSSPTDTVGSASVAESPVFVGALDLAYDPHSSEEELEVINGATAEREYAGESEVYDDSPKRSCSSTVNVENRKRSLAQSSEDELRNYGEHCQTPVNFRTSPPLEALKPNRNGAGYHSHNHHNMLHFSHHHPHHHHHHHYHQPHLLHVNNHHRTASCTSPSAALQRSATPLILTESGRGLESIHISCDSPTAALSDHPSCAAAVEADEVRSISPPAKFFHCAVSPRRRPPKSAAQRLLHPRPHRPCLDFDKMQQVRDVAF